VTCRSRPKPGHPLPRPETGYPAAHPFSLRPAQRLALAKRISSGSKPLQNHHRARCVVKSDIQGHFYKSAVEGGVRRRGKCGGVLRALQCSAERNLGYCPLLASLLLSKSRLPFPFSASSYAAPRTGTVTRVNGNTLLRISHSTRRRL